GAVVVLVVLANDHLIMITAHFPLFFLKIRHFFYRYQLVDPKDPTYKLPHNQIHQTGWVKNSPIGPVSAIFFNLP
ncbi:MAG: hypothetical protein ACRC5A_15865, partial [Enterobacteriaceae bacterium]